MSVENTLNTSRSRNGWTGSWKKGRKLGNDRTRPEEKFMFGRSRERVEWKTECNVSNNESRRKAVWDRVASVRGKKMRISRNVVIL